MRQNIDLSIERVNRNIFLNEYRNIYKFPAMELKDRLKLARKLAGKSQVEVAEAVGMKQPSYAALEKGKAKKSGYIAQIATFLEVDAQWLASGKGIGPDGKHATHSKLESSSVGSTATGPEAPIEGQYLLRLAPEHTPALGPFGNSETTLRFDPRAPRGPGIWLLNVTGRSSPMLFEARSWGEMVEGVDLAERLIEKRFPEEAIEYAHALVGVNYVPPKSKP